MNWGSTAAFLAMGGKGLYVWSSLAMCCVVIGLELWQLHRRRRRLMAQLQLESTP